MTPQHIPLNDFYSEGFRFVETAPDTYRWDASDGVSTGTIVLTAEGMLVTEDERSDTAKTPWQALFEAEHEQEGLQARRLLFGPSAASEARDAFIRAQGIAVANEIPRLTFAGWNWG